MNLVLIGFRGTGKSEVGRRLSEKLGMDLINLDEEIVRGAGFSIPQIVQKWGWPKFRELERETVERLSTQRNAVIDTGGGAVLDERNVSDLRRNGRVFWLKASPRTVAARIEKSTERPSLTEGKSFLEEIAEVLEERLSLYEAAADYEIETDGAGPEEVTRRILEILESMYSEAE